MRILAVFFLLFFQNLAFSQPDRWQQHAVYHMDIDMDADKHQYAGVQKLTYTNNSTDTLYKVFYHLYFNAFQPGSMMNARHSNIPDGDKRQAAGITNLKPDEIGWIKVKTLKQNGAATSFEENGTILEVTLAKPIMPNSSTTFDMTWDAQIPKQTRRSGRDNKEGIEFSMTQWYPKMVEYDYQGWHANPYIGREFYGVWGDFHVNISIDKKYIVAAGGILQNPQEVGYGYESKGQKVRRPKGDKLTYKFITKNVHDFAWAADPDYKHTQIVAEDGTEMHFFWQDGEGYDEQWERLPKVMSRARTIMNENFGKYPYPYYAFIQGGDGGMEYPYCTLITGDRPMNSLIGVSVHEQLHSWYQMILGTNEALYSWMDEGFTMYAEQIVENQLAKEGLMDEGKEYKANPFEGTFEMFGGWQMSGNEEPLCIHADHYNSNRAYSIGAYIKGQVYLRQLEYVVGKETLAKSMLRYFDEWKFKHPNPNDFIRIVEKQSGLELDWYNQDYVYTTRFVDYGVEAVEKESRKVTEVTLTKIGEMAMPLDIMVTYKNGDQELFHMPLVRMRGEKNEFPNATLLPDHRWTDPTFTFQIKKKKRKVKKIEIDPTNRMLDVDRENNVWEK